MLIDSHVHFWNFDKQNDAWITNNMKILQQDFLPVNILPTLQEAGVDGLVAVQAGQSETETNFLLSLAQTNSFINGVVGWVDLQNETVEDRLNYYAQFTAIKGWRHIIQTEAEGFLSGKNFIKGIAQLQLFNYTYDILVYQHQLKEVLELVQKFPNQKFVIDHCAKPDIKNKPIEPWKTLIKEIASNPNVYCKLSGLLTESNWQQWEPKDFYPYLDVVFEAFGAKRILFGSDWPVMLLSGKYVQWKNLVEIYLKPFSAEEQNNIMGTNAINFYNL